MPRQVEPLRPPSPRADTVFPPITGHEVATRITDGGHAQLTYQIHHIRTEPIPIRRPMPWFINPVIDAPTQVLNKGTEQTTIQRSNGVGRIEDNPCCRHWLVAGRSKLCGGITNDQRRGQFDSNRGRISSFHLVGEKLIGHLAHLHERLSHRCQLRR
jgi:hypothetical protein